MLAGIWLVHDGRQIDASFALRPLDGVDPARPVDIVMQVMEQSMPGRRWRLPPPSEPDEFTKA